MKIYDMLINRALNGGSGGGGGSDFSTAQIVVTNGVSRDISVGIPIIVHDPDCSMSDVIIEPGYNAFTAILYKGYSAIFIPYIPTSENVVISGDIIDDGGGYYIIMGNCTIDIINEVTD